MEKIKNLESQIQTARPKLKKISLNLYIKNIQKYYCLSDKKFDDFKSLKISDVKDVLKDTVQTSRKNIITALIVGIGSYDRKSDDKIIADLQKYLKDETVEYTEKQKDQTKSDRQSENWMDYTEVIDKAKDLYRQIIDEKLLKKKGNLTNREFNLLQSYVLLATYIKQPLRNDFGDMKVVETIPEDNDKNYLLRKGKDYTYILNAFKTREKMGAKRLPVNKDIAKLYDRWLKINDSGYIFVKENDRTKPMKPADTTRILNKIFSPKKIGSSMLRHIIASYDTRNDKSIREQEKEAKEIEDKFLHSKGMNAMYAKKS